MEFVESVFTPEKIPDGFEVESEWFSQHLRTVQDTEYTLHGYRIVCDRQFCLIPVEGKRFRVGDLESTKFCVDCDV